MSPRSRTGARTGQGPLMCRRRALVRLTVGVLTMPLLAIGTCDLIFQQSLATGFFQAVTPVITDAFRAHLGLASESTTGTGSTTPSTTFGTGTTGGTSNQTSGTGAGDLLTPTSGWTGSGFSTGGSTTGNSGTTGSGANGSSGSTGTGGGTLPGG